MFAALLPLVGCLPRFLSELGAFWRGIAGSMRGGGHFRVRSSWADRFALAVPLVVQFQALPSG